MANGFFTGIAVTVGGWLVTRHFLRHIENFEARLKQLKEKEATEDAES